jgi:hypothetical protein
MKITLKDTATLISDAQGTSDSIDDRLKTFFEVYGSKTIEPSDFKVYQFIDSNDNIVQRFDFDFFPENMLYTNITIPESWIASKDMEENQDIIFCKSCTYKAKQTQLYPFRDGKVLTLDDQNTDDVTDDTYSDKYNKTFKYFLDNDMDLICPMCFAKNSFETIK